MITIIDYEMGNLRSVQKGFERVGAEATISSDPEVLAQAEKLVLPGVGAFEDAMAALRERELVSVICEHAERGRPLLGICLGLHLLFDYGLEGGKFEGLGLVAGTVERFEIDPSLKVEDDISLSI